MSGNQCVHLFAAVLVPSGRQLYPCMTALQHGMDLFNYLSICPMFLQKSSKPKSRTGRRQPQRLWLLNLEETSCISKDVEEFHVENRFLCSLHCLNMASYDGELVFLQRFLKQSRKINFADQMLLCHEIPDLCQSFLFLNIAVRCWQIIVTVTWQSRILGKMTWDVYSHG